MDPATIPWAELLKAGGINAALAFVVWMLWKENRELQKELRDTHKQQAEFWREVARQVKVEGKT
jgi:phosphoribosylcarboxyaminoimidazole (NCAIR) mutase